MEGRAELPILEQNIISTSSLQVSAGTITVPSF